MYVYFLMDLSAVPDVTVSLADRFTGPYQISLL